MTEADILLQVGDYWIRQLLAGSGRFKPKSLTYRVYQDGLTHATLRGSFGTLGQAVDYATTLHAQKGVSIHG